MDRKYKRKGPTFFTMEQLKQITDSFSEERKLGEGAYGIVYKGVLEDGKEIAVKRIGDDTSGSVEHQFMNEYRNLIKIKHESIVKLVGYSLEQKHDKQKHLTKKIQFYGKTYRAFCLEFVPKGSLKSNLSDEKQLDWGKRYKIIRGTCKALKYLHELQPPLLHLDIKPDNILMDNNMEPKLSDFGLSMFLEQEEETLEKYPIGTRGYIPPENIDEGIVSKKFDIFSLGVLMVEIVAGRRPTKRLRSTEITGQKFIKSVYENWRRRLQLISTGSTLDEYCQQVKTCTEIALDCMEEDRRERPDIADIVGRLEEMDKRSPWWSVSELIRIYPRELRFPWDTDSYWMSCPLSLINETDSWVGFVVKKEHYPDKYYTIGTAIAVVGPRCTCSVIVTMFGQHLPPLSRDSFEIVMITMDKPEDLEGLAPLIRSEPNNEWNVLKRSQKFEILQSTMLTAVVCEPAALSEVTVITSEMVAPKGLGGVCSIDVHPTEPRILMCHRKGAVSIWNYETQEKEKVFQLSNATTYSRYLDRTWERQIWKTKAECPYYFCAAKFIDRKQWVVVGDSSAQVHVYRWPTMARLGELSTTRAYPVFYRRDLLRRRVDAMAVHPSSPLLLTSCGDAIRMWDWDNHWSGLIFFESEGGTNEIKLNPDTGTFACGVAIGDAVKVWTTAQRGLITKFERASSVDYPFTGSDRQYIITNSPDCDAKIWDWQGLQTNKLVHSFTSLRRGKSTKRSLIACHPTLPLFVVGSDDGIISFWSTTASRLEKMVRRKPGELRSIQFIGLKRVVIEKPSGVEILELDLEELARNKEEDLTVGMELPEGC